MVLQVDNEMNGVIGLDAALLGNNGPGITWANEMTFGMNHAPSAGLIARPADLQSSLPPLLYDCPLAFKDTSLMNK